MLIGLLIILSLSSLNDTARILGIAPLPSYSHQLFFRPIWRELAKRGHEVVVVTTDPENKPQANLREIDVHFLYKHAKDKLKVLQTYSKPLTVILWAVRPVCTRIAEDLLGHPEVSALLHNETEHYDLVISELWITLMYGFAGKFKCPLIGLTSLDLNDYRHEFYGNPIHPVAYPDIFSDYSPNGTTLWQKIVATMMVQLYKVIEPLQIEARAEEEKVWRKHFGTEMPSMQDLQRKVDMIFVNAVPTLTHRPTGPATVNIGGNMHLPDPKPLPQDLQEFLDGAKDGAIYVSLGTNIKGDFITNKVRQAFLGAFSELPFNILWKLDVKLEDVPKNVKIVEWSPQQDVFRHANIKVFVFQGGLHSLEEAIINQIPMVGIPFVSEQDTNVKKMTKNGFGMSLNRDTITKESLKEAILEVATNPKYKLAVAKMAEIIVDQPMTGLEKAVWWTEYVLRHKGASHLRNPIMDLSFLEYYMLDMYFILIFVLFMIIMLIYLILRSILSYIWSLISPKSNPKLKTKTN